MPFCETMKMRYDKGIYDDIGYTGIKELTAEEMDEINGGLWNFVASAACFATSCVCDYLVSSGTVSGDAANVCRAISGVTSVSSIALSFGVGGAVMAGSKTAAKFVGKKAVEVTAADGAKRGRIHRNQWYRRFNRNRCKCVWAI